jgi:pyruvate dehydrogenase E1 component alpha subunit
MQKLASFEVNFLQYLDEAGKPANDLPEFADDPEVMVGLFRSMQLIRHLDARAVGLQRVGRMRTYPSSEGQEAIGVGAGSCLSEKDIMVPYYRSTAALIEHGVKPHEILLYWGGDERGSDYQDPRARHDFPIAVPIATQLLHAAGIATAIKLGGQNDRAVLTEIGEGGTSEGEFYESLNIAGIWSLPMVCVVNNNQWAISVPSEMQTAAETYAQKAIAGGIEGLQVDGNDIIAVKGAVSKALEKARSGAGPTLIEAVTYRLCDHTTADDASRYQDAKARAEAEKKEPLKRLSKYLLNLGAVNEKQLKEFEAAAKAEVEKEVGIYFDILENKPQPPSAMFDYLYAELPERFRAQREDAIRRGGE